MFKVRQFQVFGRLGMKTLNVRLVIVTRLDKSGTNGLFN